MPTGRAHCARRCRRKGRIIDSQREVGGYPTCEPTARKLDVPTEGVEAWLATFADKVE